MNHRIYARRMARSKDDPHGRPFRGVKIDVRVPPEHVTALDAIAATRNADMTAAGITRFERTTRAHLIREAVAAFITAQGKP